MISKTNRNEQFFRKIVEDAGGIFVGIQRAYGTSPDAVLFQRVKGGSTIALYTIACRNAHDIELALKADAEKFATKVFA
jgi:hypothetical protein